MTTLVKIFEFSLLYVNTLALNPQWMVTCIAVLFSGQMPEGAFSVSISALSSRGPYLGLKIFLWNIFSKENSTKTCKFKGVKLLTLPHHPSNSVEGRVCICLPHSPLADWVAVSRADPGVTKSKPSAWDLFHMGKVLAETFQRSWEAVWKSSHEKHAKNPVLMQTTWLRLHLAI